MTTYNSYQLAKKANLRHEYWRTPHSAGSSDRGAQSRGSHEDGRAADQGEIAELPNRKLGFSFCKDRLKKTMMGRNKQGFALTAVIIASVIFAVAAAAVLILALSMARRGGFDARRLQARYAAEAGLVWAKENLWANPGFCNDNITVNGFAVSITGTNCGTNNITIQSRIDPY